MFIGSSHEQRPPKPRHPDIDRWMLAFCTFAIVLAAVFGAAGVRWLEPIHGHVGRWVREHAEMVTTMLKGVRFAALGIGVVVAVQLGWAFVVHPLVYRLRLMRLRGHYEGIILPKPDTVRRSTPSRSNPDAAHAYWDRVIGMLQNTARPGTPTYLAAELWGGPTGRVTWGYFLPDSFASERLTLRSLITADRDNARLVPQPDPMLTALTPNEQDPTDTGARYLATALLQLRAPDYLPLAHDGMMLPGLAAALRTGRDVEAAGVSIIASPAPAMWARRVHTLVERWQWSMRYRGAHNSRWREEIDNISVKAQQPHARCCIRVTVIARTKATAETTCRAVCSTLTANQKRHRSWTQGWTVKRRRVVRVIGARVPLMWRVRAPMRVLPWVLPVFPLT